MPKFKSNATYTIELPTEDGKMEVVPPKGTATIENPVLNDVLKGYVQDRTLTVTDDDEGDFESDDLRDEIDKAKADKAKVEQERDEAQTKVATLTDEVSDLTERLKALEEAGKLDAGAAEDAAGQIKDLTAEVERLKSENGALTKQVAEANKAAKGTGGKPATGGGSK